MRDFDSLLQKHGKVSRFYEFQNLMRFRIRKILLVSSLYDSFILEEDGQLYEMIFSVYSEMNLTQAPNFTRVSRGETALRKIKSGDQFDLIIVTPNLADMNAVKFAGKVRSEGLDIPVVLLTFENRELLEILTKYDTSVFERIFIWQGDFRVLMAIVKYIEDRRNLIHDTQAVGVQVVLVIEDNIHFYSSFLPQIYTELFRHHNTLISEGVNVPHKLLRMRARPKIILCDSYEEAWDYYKNFEEYILGVISDIEFPYKGEKDPKAGIRFARAVKASHFDIPILLQSDSPDLKLVAEELGVSFLLKTSSMLIQRIRTFISKNFAFGDFVFRLPDGKEVGRAKDMQEMEKQLYLIPDESLRFHAERNHFSRWLKARTEFWLAHRLRPRKVTDYKSIEELRESLISYLKEFRQERSRGSITDLDPDTFDPNSSFARIGSGSLGGKARGLAFANTLINTFGISNQFKGVRIFIPPAVVLATDIFDQFLEENNLREFALDSDDDEEILQRFLQARFPETVEYQLMELLELFHCPLAIRSSSLLEDSRYLPFAGIYKTYMLPNNHHNARVRLIELLSSIKRIYASTFSSHTKSYMMATPYRLEEEKMAVIIQKMIGTQHEWRFYPDFSGVARSHNFYPISPAKTEDGIVPVALGQGDSVIEGDRVVRFCPKYPRHLNQFSSVDDYLKYSQRELYVLRLEDPDDNSDHSREMKLEKLGLDYAEKDGTLALVGSTYSVENDTITDGLSRQGPRLVTFAPVLKSDMFPLSDILELILEMGHWGMSSPVEIEFAVNLSLPPGQPKEFAFLQIRPLIKCQEAEELNVDNYQEEQLICQSPQVLGNGVIDNIYDIIVVDFNRFDRSQSTLVAHEVGSFNAKLLQKSIPYLLIGVGRWGSADPWLGIPVRWDEISGAKIIIETGFKDFKVVPSQGTHFFQNITSFMVGYFTVNSYTNEGFVDWEWLAKQPAVEEKKYTRHLHFNQPIIARMNGHKNRGVILKPGVEDIVQNTLKLQSSRNTVLVK